MFSSVLIGEGAISLRCLDTLAKGGLSPAIIASFDGSLIDAAARFGIPHAGTRAEIASACERCEYDYLFSVNNPWIIPSSLLSRARQAAINFHNSLLPRYGGLHASSWALAHGENEHGISWHQMLAEIDAGPIFKQLVVPISSSDTALTLNAKGFDAAALAFEELVADILAQRLQSRPQQGERSYYGARVRPATAGLIDFDRPAAELSNLVRALDFGHSHNPLGMAKVLLGDRAIVARRLRVLGYRNGAAPGTLLACDEREIVVATQTDDVVLSGLSELGGEELSAADVNTHLKRRLGSVLLGLDAAARQAISDFNERVCLHEAYFAKRLASLIVLQHSYATHGTSTEVRCVDLPLTAAVLARENASDVHAFDVVAAYLARLSTDAQFDVGLLCEASAQLPAGLFAAVAPLRLSREHEVSAADFLVQARADLQRAQAAGSYALDITSRRPELLGRPSKPSWPIALSFASEPRPEPFANLTFWLPSGAQAPSLLVPADKPSWQLDALDAQLACVAQALIASPNLTVADLPLLDDAERHRILVEWNQTQAPIPDACVHTLIERQAAATPQAVAVRFGANSLTYAELDRRANQLAHALVTRGVRKGDLVALCIARSVDVVVGMLGILKSGAAYVPIDPSYPADRVAAMLSQSAVRVAVTTHNLRSTLLTQVELTVCFDSDVVELSQQATHAPQVDVTPHDLIYVIFTSGSTGAPKGVQIRHRSLVNHSLAIAHNCALTARDRILCSASVSFDVAAEQIYPALFSGAQVVVRPDNLLESFQRFDQFLQDTGITTLILPTAFWHEWVRELAARGLPVAPTLRLCCVGTEKALGEHLVLWQRLSLGRVQFFQGYGPTETTVTCTMYMHDGSAIDPARPLPIGRPLPNTQIYVLDAQLEPVPVGMHGEIYVGGAGVARGYLGRPDLTAERFIQSPFNSEGGLLYRTGDVARYEPDGQLVYVGRSDFQVKIRGHRVELGEIEALIRTHDQVDECVVLLREDVPGQRRLVAYVVAKHGELDTEGLAELVSARLPEYMAPAAYAVLSAFPMTPNLKIDRQALQPPTVERARASIPPSSDEEFLVAQVWSDVLGITGFGIDESFFDLGGDSLLAVRVFERLQTSCSAKLSLADLFAAPTISQLAARMRSGGGIDAPTVICLKPGDASLPVFLVCGIGLYLPLARALRTCSAVYAMYLPLEAEILQLGAQLPPVEELAARYIELLRSHSPDGPYALGGISFGGVLAYEMARQLRAQGESVPVLALLDPILPRARLRGPLHWLAAQARSVQRHGAGILARRASRRFNKLVQRVNPSFVPPEDASESTELDPFRTRAYGDALELYDQRIGHCEGPAILFRALDSEEGALEETLGFRGLVRGQLSMHGLPGDHLGILTDPHVRVLAEHLDIHLAEHRASSPL